MLFQFIKKEIGIAYFDFLQSILDFKKNQIKYNLKFSKGVLKNNY